MMRDAAASDVAQQVECRGSAVWSSALLALHGSRIFQSMSTLAEIEQAADALTPEQKRELILFLAARLRAVGAEMPDPRRFTTVEMAGWISEDDEDMERFRRGA